MEFVSKDADMVLVKTSPEELKKLAAIIRGVHGWDFVMAEMDLDDPLGLAERMEKSKEGSWVFHGREAFYLGSVIGTALYAIPLERLNYFSPIDLKKQEIEKLKQDIEAISDLARKA